MSAMFSVPAEMADRIRVAAHSVLGESAQEIAQVAIREGREEHPDWYTEHREHYTQACALLDQIGWSSPSQPVKVCLDLREHDWAFTRALDLALGFTDDELKDARCADRERATRGEPPLRERKIEQARALQAFASTVRDQLLVVIAELGGSR